MRYGGFSDIRFRAKSVGKHCVGRRKVMIQRFCCCLWKRCDESFRI